MFHIEDVDGPCVFGPRGSGAMFTQEDADCVKHVAKAFSVDLFPRQDGFLIERGGFSIAEDSPDEQAPTAAASASRDEAMAFSRNLAVDAGFSVSTEAPQAPLAPEADSPPGFICPQVTAEGPKAYDETAKWSVGHDCGDWVARSAPALEQAQALICNAACNVRKLSQPLLRQLASELGVILGRVVQTTYGYAHNVTAFLLGISPWRSYKVYATASAANWCLRRAIPPAEEEEASAVASATSTAVLKALTREALSVAIEGQPDGEYVRRVARAHMNGWPVGDKFHSPRFLCDVEHLAAQCVRGALAIELSAKLPGMGKRSRFAIFFDKVCIQGGLFSRHEALLLIGISYVSASDGSLRYRMLACPSAGLRQDGSSVCALVLEALAQAPLRIGRRRLREGLAGTGGDGAVVSGGPGARHMSSRAADLIWQSAHPTGPLLTSWDLFHRAGVADLRAVHRQGLAREVIDIHKAMGALFGVGRGRVLLRAVAFELADAISVPSRAPVTREGVHAERNAAELVKNYRVYHTAMKAKMELAREGSGARSLTSLVDIGRRLSAVDFVVFLTIFRDGNTSCVRPLNTMAQRAGEEGPETERRTAKCVAQLEGLAGALALCQKWLWLSMLLLPYISGDGVARVWRALRYRQDLRLLPTFVRAIPEILVRYQFDGCLLQEFFHYKEGWDSAKYELLAAHCTCDTRTGTLVKS